MNIDKYFNYLEESPMFHFSLHSKELFHSNFLAWLGMDSELRPVFKAVMEGLGIDKTFIESWGDDFEVLREKKHLDLVIKAKDTTRKSKKRNGRDQLVEGNLYVVIENKIKSIPNEAQLNGYNSDCQANTVKLLLVITGDPKELNNGWRQVNYSQVVAALKGSLDLVENTYKKAIIEDYIGMVEALVDIIKSQTVNLDSPYLYFPSKELNDLRIADLVDKWRAAKIAEMISSKSGLNCGAGYTNKQSLIETFAYFGDIMVGIQIQGGQYRRCIMGHIKESEIVDLSKGFLSDTRDNFRSNMISLYEGVFEEDPIKGEKNRNFNSYGKKTEGATFWYQYVRLNPQATIKQVMDCIDADMKKVAELFG